jgi:hypothetical protein
MHLRVCEWVVPMWVSHRTKCCDRGACHVQIPVEIKEKVLPCGVKENTKDRDIVNYDIRKFFGASSSIKEG